MKDKPNTKEELIEQAWKEIRKVPVTYPADRYLVPVMTKKVLKDLGVHQNTPFIDTPMYVVTFRKKRTNQGDEWEFESIDR